MLYTHYQGRSQLEAEEAVASSDLELQKCARRFTYFSPMLAGYNTVSTADADGYFIVKRTYASTAIYHLLSYNNPSQLTGRATSQQVGYTRVRSRSYNHAQALGTISA